MSKIKMPKNIRTSWLKALRSGRYKQVSSELHENGKNCCLGVLGRIVRVPIKELEENSMPSGLNAKQAAKFPSCLVKINKKKESKGNTKFAHKLANMNDKGADFKEIATYIEKKTIGV